MNKRKNERKEEQTKQRTREGKKEKGNMEERMKERKNERKEKKKRNKAGYMGQDGAPGVINSSIPSCIRPIPSSIHLTVDNYDNE